MDYSQGTYQHMNSNNNINMTELTTYADDLHFVTTAVIGPIICFVGLAGNLLSLVTWSRPNMWSSTGRYLTGQAVADFFVLFFWLLNKTLPKWNPNIVYLKSYGWYFCYIGYPLFYLAVLTSIWFTVTVTLDRWVKVCWISMSKHYCNQRKANIGLAIVTLLCFMINMPHFFSYTPALYRDTNSSGKSYEKTDYQKSDFAFMYDFWAHCVFLTLGPCVLVVYFNIRIIQTIAKTNEKMLSKRSRNSLKRAKDNETQITRLLMAVSFTFVIFIGPECLVKCFWMQQLEWADEDAMSAFWAVFKTGILFNSASNFFLYCLTGVRFRKELRKVLGMKPSKDDQASVFNHSKDTCTEVTSDSTDNV